MAERVAVLAAGLRSEQRKIAEPEQCQLQPLPVSTFITSYGASSSPQAVMQLDAGRPGPAGALECFLCCFSAFQPQHSQRKPLQPPLLLTALQRPSLPQHSLPGAERRAAWPHCWPSIQREREAE